MRDNYDELADRVSVEYKMEEIIEAENLMNDVLRRQYMSAVAQRDELLAALKDLNETMKDIEGYVYSVVNMSRTALGIGARNAIIKADSAIAKCEQK